MEGSIASSNATPFSKSICWFGKMVFYFPITFL
jgi:hypothetical protein